MSSTLFSTMTGWTPPACDAHARPLADRARDRGGSGAGSSCGARHAEWRERTRPSPAELHVCCARDRPDVDAVTTGVDQLWVLVPHVASGWESRHRTAPSRREAHRRGTEVRNWPRRSRALRVGRSETRIRASGRGDLRWLPPHRDYHERLGEAISRRGAIRDHHSCGHRASSRALHRLVEKVGARWIPGGDQRPERVRDAGDLPRSVRD